MAMEELILNLHHELKLEQEDFQSLDPILEKIQLPNLRCIQAGDS